MNPDREQIAELRAKYYAQGIMWGSDFALPPGAALSLVQDLAHMGVVIIGCDLWRYVDKSKTSIVTLLGAGTGVSNEAFASITPEEGAELVGQFLEHELPDDAELVSLLLKDGDLAEWFAQEERPGNGDDTEPSKHVGD